MKAKIIWELDLKDFMVPVIKARALHMPCNYCITELNIPRLYKYLIKNKL